MESVVWMDVRVPSFVYALDCVRYGNDNVLNVYRAA